MKDGTRWSEKDENIIMSIPRKDIDLYKLSVELDRSVGAICKKIRVIRGFDLRTDIIGSKRRAINFYNLIKLRCKALTAKNKCYENIELEVSKDDFIKWFIPKDFKGCSIDRINNLKNYSLDNMQVISLSENIRKDKIKSKNGYCECFKCKEIKPIEEFAKDKRRLNGHSTICKKCDAKRKKEN